MVSKLRKNSFIVKENYVLRIFFFFKSTMLANKQFLILAGSIVWGS